MSDRDTIDVINALNSSLGEVSMHATAGEIVAAGRARRRHRRLVGMAAGIAGIAGISALGLAVTPGHPSTVAGRLSTAPATSAGRGGGAQVHVHNAGFTVDSQPDGSVQVTWNKFRMFDDHAGLAAALIEAGMPVTTRDGEFCAGPGEDPTPGPSEDPMVRADMAALHGVDQVMKIQVDAADNVTLVFTPSAMPAGKQLFLGYQTPAQIKITHGFPVVLMRLVPASGPLTCTATVPQSWVHVPAPLDSINPPSGGPQASPAQ